MGQVVLELFLFCFVFLSNSGTIESGSLSYMQWAEAGHPYIVNEASKSHVAGPLGTTAGCE